MMTTHSRLERFEHRTEWPLAAVAIAFLGLYSVQVLAQPRGLTARAVEVALLGLYCIIVADYPALSRGAATRCGGPLRR